MSEFHFLRPAWFLALIPALALVLLLWRRRARADIWRGIVSPALLAHLLIDRGRPAQRLPLLLLGLGWLLAATALAGPTWERQPQPAYRASIDRVLVLDMSPSMAAGDLVPDRLSRTRLAIQTLLAESREGRIALVVFGAEPHVVTPLTDDTATIEALLPALTTDVLPVPGDRAGPALRTAAELLARAGSTRAEVALLSDGIGDPADTLAAIHDLRRRGVPTSVLGVGTADGAPVPAPQGGFERATDGGLRLARLDEAGLTALASAGGGRYLRLGQGPVTQLLTRSAARNPALARSERRGPARWVEQGPWLLLPLLLVAAGGFRRGWLGVLALLLLPPPAAQAFDWQDLWSRPDQQAARLLEQGKGAAAAERFEDPAWQAMARYQAGDYPAAAKGFGGPDADSQYNRGNALARAGRLQEALAAYDRALEQRPDDEDARFNRHLVEKLLQSRQQPAGGQDGSGSAQDRSQAGGAGKGAAGDDGRGRRGESGADRATAGKTAKRSGQGPEPAAASGARTPRPSGEDTDAEPRAGGRAARQGRSGEPAPDRSDGAGQARADVAPSVDGTLPRDAGVPPDRAEASGRQPGEAAGDDTAEPMTEQQIALEQWLHQVPDDPAGLLRRKFMLEHLLRQQGRRSP